MGIEHSGRSTRAAICGAFLCLALAAADAQATFHTWRIAELYSDAAGVVQFVELHEAFNADFQDQFAGILLTSQQGSTTRTYAFPTNLPSSSTANKRLLIATPAFAALGVVTPDYVVPAPFLFVGGGTLDFASVDSVTYSSLPTDGVSSLDRSGSAVANSPTNFSGQTGSIAAPPPLVYKPLEPCRIMDTRSATLASGVQGPIAGNVLYSIPGFVTAGQNWGLYGGAAASDCGLTSPPGNSIHAVALVATILNPNFDANLGISDIDTLSTVLSNVALNYTHGQGLSTMYIVPQIASNSIYFGMPAELSAQLIYDVVGYYVVADTTALQCTTQASAPTSIAGSNGTGNAISPACSAGDALTAGSCHSTSPTMSLAQDMAASGNAAWFCSAINRGGAAASLTATATCCRVPGK